MDNKISAFKNSLLDQELLKMDQKYLIPLNPLLCLVKCSILLNIRFHKMIFKERGSL